MDSCGPSGLAIAVQEKDRRGSSAQQCGLCDPAYILVEEIGNHFHSHLFFLPLEAVPPALVRRENMAIMVAKPDFLKSRKSRL